MDKNGFTLTELLITVAIIGILAMIAIPVYIGQQKRAVRVEAYTNLESLRLLEEQFFAERGRYTNDQGDEGNTPAIRDANLIDIQTSRGPGDDALPGFRPGAGTNFSYRILQNNQLMTPVTSPPTWVASPAGTLCFVAIATGVAGTRVADEVFAIDCFNNKNF